MLGVEPNSQAEPDASEGEKLSLLKIAMENLKKGKKTMTEKFFASNGRKARSCHLKDC